MEITIIILGLVSIIFGVSFLIFYKKYKNLKNNTEQIFNDLNKPLRNGYYINPCYQKKMATGTEYKYNAIMFVTELDRYTNGKSKIKLDRVEIQCDDANVTKSSAIDYNTDHFVDLKSTADIEWLESEISIKQERKEKLEKIKNVLKK